MKKSAALDQLNSALGEVDSLLSLPPGEREHTKWYGLTLSRVEAIFGTDSHRRRKFAKLSFDPGITFGDRAAAFQASQERGLRNARKQLEEMKTDITTLWPDLPPEEPSETSYDRLVSRLKNIPGIAWILVLSAVVIGVSQLTGALKDLTTAFSPHVERQQLRLRDSYISLVNPQRFTFMLDHVAGSVFDLQEVRVVSTQLQGVDAWDVKKHAQGGTGPYSYGEGIVAVSCSEFAFTHELDETPMAFTIKPFPPGKTRKFYAEFPPDTYVKWMNEHQPIRSRVEVVKQGEVIWTTDVSPNLTGEFWSQVFHWRSMRAL